MRAIAFVAAAGLISCAAANPSAAVYAGRATARDASAIAAHATGESSAFDLADWIPSDQSAPWVIERRAGRTLLIDGTLRAVLSPNGSILVARERTQRAITQVFAPRDGLWVFVTEDGLVLSSPDFLGSFATRAELPAGVDRSRKRFRRTTGIVALTDGTCWTLDAPATPRRLSDPAIDHVIEAAHIDATRALLVTTPGQPWLWRQDLRSATPIDIGEDVAVELDAQTRVLALRNVWKWTDAQRLVIDSARAEPPSSFDPAEDELQRWRQWRRRAMFPFDQFCVYRAATEDAVISVGAEPEQLVVRRRTGEDIVLPAVDELEGLQRFGASIVWREQGGAVRLVNTTNGSVTFVPSAPGAAPSTTVLAEDGSIIVNEAEDQRHLTFWTPQTSWTSTTLDAPLLVRHARAQRLYGERDETIFEATPNANGTVSLREVVRLSALRPSDSLRELIATNAHEQWRAWLFREGARRCFVVIEDGLSASVVDAPSCERATSVYFAGRHFGIVETAEEVHVTRDGRTWSHLARGQLDLQQALVQSLLSLVTPTAAIGDAIVAWGNERIARDPSRSTPVARRSTPLPVARVDHEDAPTGTARCRLDGSRTTVRVSRSDVLDFAVDLIHARPSTDERSTFGGARATAHQGRTLAILHGRRAPRCSQRAGSSIPSRSRLTEP